MHQVHRKALKKFSSSIQTEIVRYFVEQGVIAGDVPGDSFLSILDHAQLCQADIVLCLLRLDTRQSLTAVSSLVGRPIKQCPPRLQMARGPKPTKRRARTGDDKTFKVIRKPMKVDAKSARRLLDTGLYARIALMSDGVSVRQVLAKGATRRDIRIAVRRGYVELGA